MLMNEASISKILKVGNEMKSRTSTDFNEVSIHVDKQVINEIVDLFFVTETWLSAQGDEAKTVEFSPSGFDV